MQKTLVTRVLSRKWKVFFLHNFISIHLQTLSPFASIPNTVGPIFSQRKLTEDKERYRNCTVAFDILGVSVPCKLAILWNRPYAEDNFIINVSFQINKTTTLPAAVKLVSLKCQFCTCHSHVGGVSGDTIIIVTHTCQSNKNVCFYTITIQSRPIVTRGATTAEKLRGIKVWVPTTAKGWAGCWVREGVAPFRCEGPWVSPPENLGKLRC